MIGENPDDPDVFKDTDAGMAPIRDSINDAIQEIVMLTGGYKRQYFLPLREGAGFYRMKIDNGELGWITDVWDVNLKRRLEQTDLIRLTAYNPRWMIDSSDPLSYFPIGKDVIGVYPKPSGDTNVLEITLVEIPTAYEKDTDRIKLRDSFQHATVHFAVSEYWASRGDTNSAHKSFSIYLDTLGLRKQYDPDINQGKMFQTNKEPYPTVTA